jgi:hypothetical protein
MGGIVPANQNKYTLPDQMNNLMQAMRDKAAEINKGLGVVLDVALSGKDAMRDEGLAGSPTEAVVRRLELNKQKRTARLYTKPTTSAEEIKAAVEVAVPKVEGKKVDTKQ